MTNWMINENLLFVLAKIAYSAPKGTISLAEGMPNEETFPFTEISVKLYDGSSFILSDGELGAALQYIPTQGYPPLVQVENILFSTLSEFSPKISRTKMLEIVIMTLTHDA